MFEPYKKKDWSLTACKCGNFHIIAFKALAYRVFNYVFCLPSLSYYSTNIRPNCHIHLNAFDWLSAKIFGIANFLQGASINSLKFECFLCVTMLVSHIFYSVDCYQYQMAKDAKNNERQFHIIVFFLLYHKLNSNEWIGREDVNVCVYWA